MIVSTVSEAICKHPVNWPTQDRSVGVELLVNCIKVEGQLVPGLGVRDPNGGITLIDGNRRLEAIRLLGLTTFDVVVLDQPPTEAELLFMQEALDNHFTKQTLFERLRRFERLRELGETVGKIAQRTGYSQGAVSRILGLSRLCDEARESLRRGVDVEKAFVASQIDNPAKQVELMKEAASLTREQVRRKARGAEIRAHKAIFPVASGLTVVVQGKAITLNDAIETLVIVIKELKQAQKDHLDVVTAARVMRNKAAVQP